MDKLVYILNSKAGDAGDGINGTIYGIEADAMRAAKAQYGEDWDDECEIVPADRADVDATAIR